MVDIGLKGLNYLVVLLRERLFKNFQNILRMY